MYRIGLEEQSGTFFGVVVDKRDSVIFKTSGRNVEEVIKKISVTVQGSPESVDYIGISTDAINRAFSNLTIFPPIALIRIGASNNNFSYKSENYNFRSRKEPVIHTFFVRGMINLTGEDDIPLDISKVRDICGFLNDNKKIKAIGILGLFSNFFPRHEERVARELRKICKRKVSICLSSDISHRSLVYREGFLVSNLKLLSRISPHLIGLSDKIRPYIGNADIFLLKFDGSLIPSKLAVNYPVLLRDATQVSKIVGATTSTKIKNIYMLTQVYSKVGAMSTNESRPIVKRVWDSLRIESDSFTYSVSRLLNDNSSGIYAMLENIHKNGKSTIIMDKRLLGRFPKVERLGIFPMQLDGYLGALGAATAPIRSTTDFLGSIQFQGRKEVLERVKNVAEEKIVEKGASVSSIKVVQVDEIPVSYLPWDTLRIRITLEGKPGKT